MADERPEELEVEDPTVRITGEHAPRTGWAADGVVGGSGGCGGGVSSLTSSGNEKIPPSRRTHK